MLEVTRGARRESTPGTLWGFVSRLLLCFGWLHPRKARSMVLAVPLLSSLPGAPVDIYLDFDGHVQREWGTYSNIVTPPFDQDGDVRSFNPEELATIREIWARVAEDFAPFNVNVTTVHPKSFSNGRAVHVVIGGHYADWYGIRVGGVSFANSFVNSMPNVVYVFSKALGGGSPKYVADLISHEVGHTFGLEEQSVYDDGGARIRDYNTGDAKRWGPLMGNSLAADRSIWHYGTSTSLRNVQDDVAIIARPENGFGLRRDDYSDYVETAEPISSDGSYFEARGIIGSVRDADCFEFNFDGGRIRLCVDVAEFGPNLNSKLELRSVEGRVLARDTGEDRLPSELEVNLRPGTYCAVVQSFGSYGDLGQYTFRGEIVADPSVPVTQLASKRAEPKVADVSEPSDASTTRKLADASSSGSGDQSAPAPVAGPATR